MLTLLTLSVYQDIFNQFVHSYFTYRFGDAAHKAVVVCPPELKVPIGFQRVDDPVGGLPVKYNAGLAACEGDVLVAFDDTQFVQYHTMRTLYNVAYSDPKIGMVCPLIDGGVGDDSFKARNDAPELADTLTSYGNVAFIKREVIERVGGWNEAYTKFGWEDIDYGLRILQAGYRVVVTNRVVFKHGFGDKECSSTIDRMGGIQLHVNQGIFENIWRGKLDWLPPIAPDNPTTAVLAHLQRSK